MGRRTTETAPEAFPDFYERTDGRLPELITTDEYAPYASVIRDVYGVLKEDRQPDPAAYVRRLNELPGDWPPPKPAR